jgi:hypothetical protein
LCSTSSCSSCNTTWRQVSPSRRHTRTLSLQGYLSPSDDLFDWMQADLVDRAFTEPVCGDGTCEWSPEEYTGFGRFGCIDDCNGYLKTSKITVDLKPLYNASQAVLGWDLRKSTTVGATTDFKWNIWSETAAENVWRKDPDRSSPRAPRSRSSAAPPPPPAVPPSSGAAALWHVGECERGVDRPPSAPLVRKMSGGRTSTRSARVRPAPAPPLCRRRRSSCHFPLRPRTLGGS